MTNNFQNVQNMTTTMLKCQGINDFLAALPVLCNPILVHKAKPTLHIDQDGLITHTQSPISKYVYNQR